MALPMKLAAMAATMTVATSAAAWWAVWPDANDAPAEARTVGVPSRPEPIVGPEDVTLCVGPAPDRILRATALDGSCPPDHTELRLEEEDERICELCDPDEAPEPRDPSRDGQLASIEDRIRALEKSAYFEVVTSDGRPVFRVEPGGARVFNPGGVAVAAIGSAEEGGYFTGRTTQGSGYASIGASGTRGGVRLLEGDLSRLELKVQDGKASLRIPSAAGLIAGLGESKAGPGLLLVGTLRGLVRSTLQVQDGFGMVTTNGASESGGTALKEAGIGGGLFGLDDTRGNAAVKMGHNGHRYGIVLAGPTLGFPLIPKSGLPGSYFMGCASAVRPACVPSVDP